MDPVNEKIATYEECENKILRLRGVMENPYFARIDFKFEDEPEYEKIYIGRSSLKDEETREIYIYDWRSPIASVFYRFVTGPAYYDAPAGRITGEVRLKRQYEIAGGTLQYFFDADVQIVDEFLRKLLSQNASLKMKTIVETIQKEQDIIIRDMENDLMMVQGVAGSGKTSIALHRAAYLMYQGLTTKLSASNIAILSPNPLFEQYISNVLPELGENNVLSVVFEEILTSVLRGRQLQKRNLFLESLITGKGGGRLVKESIVFKTSVSFLRLLNLFIEDIPHRWIRFEDIYYRGRRVVSRAELKRRVLERGKTPLGMKLRQLEDFILERVREADTKRIDREEENAIKEKIRGFTQLDVFHLYRCLFENKEYFCSLAEQAGCREGAEEIFVYTGRHAGAPFIYYDDAIALACLKLKLYGSHKYKNVRQVVIDEAQDYYPLQYEIFRILFYNAQFTVLGDMNQTLGKQEDLTFYEQVEEVLDKKKSSLLTMDKSFRCTNEILRYSMKFIDHRPEVQSFNRDGEEPQVYTAEDPDSLCEQILAETELCRNQGYGSIGLLCKSEENAAALYTLLKDKTKIRLIKGDSMEDLQGVFIIPVYMSKGLEFDAVLICDAGADHYQSEDDKKLLYISCTRALHRLNLFCEGAPSGLLR